MHEKVQSVLDVSSFSFLTATFFILDMFEIGWVLAVTCHILLVGQPFVQGWFKATAPPVSSQNPKKSLQIHRVSLMIR